MAKINPTRFFREVRSEVAKVTWPTRKETVVSTIMVFVMAVLASLFFLLIDQVFAWAVQFIFRVGV